MYVGVKISVNVVCTVALYACLHVELKTIHNHLCHLTCESDLLLRQVFDVLAMYTENCMFHMQ